MYLVREQNNDLLLLLTDEKPFKHGGSWKTKRNCQSVMLDKSQHPEVQWIDREATECESYLLASRQKKHRSMRHLSLSQIQGWNVPY